MLYMSAEAHKVGATLRLGGHHSSKQGLIQTSTIYVNFLTCLGAFSYDPSRPLNLFTLFF